MRVQKGKGGSLTQYRGKRATALPLRRLQHTGGGGPAQRPCPIPE